MTTKKRKTYAQGVLDGKQAISDSLRRPDRFGMPVRAGSEIEFRCLGNIFIRASVDLYIIGLPDGLVIKKMPEGII